MYLNSRGSTPYRLGPMAQALSVDAHSGAEALAIALPSLGCSQPSLSPGEALATALPSLGSSQLSSSPGAEALATALPSLGCSQPSPSPGLSVASPGAAAVRKRPAGSQAHEHCNQTFEECWGAGSVRKKGRLACVHDFLVEVNTAAARKFMSCRGESAQDECETRDFMERQCHHLAERLWSEAGWRKERHWLY